MVLDPINESGEAGMGSKAVWIAIIGALGVILAAVIPSVFEHLKGHEINFSGIVRKQDGNAIPGAQIVIAVDQDTPQVYVSDSNGIFHVPVRETTKSLTLTISAAGFETVRRDANPHRSGAEEIDLEAKSPGPNPPSPISPPPKPLPALVNPSSIKGVWHGVIDIPGQPLHFVLRVANPGGDLSATADSPDQGAANLAVDSISLSGHRVRFAMLNLGVQFEGNLEQNHITGNFVQRGISYSLILIRD